MWAGQGRGQQKWRLGAGLWESQTFAVGKGEKVCSLQTKSMHGFVYILLNPSFGKLLKIGMTERSPEERASELSAHTGVPGRFVVAHEEFVEDCVLAEQKIHQALDSSRSNPDREFFEIKLKDAIRIVESVAKEVNARFPSSKEGAVRRYAPVQSRPGYPDRFLAQRIEMWCESCKEEFFVTMLPKETHSFCPYCSKLSYPK